MPITIGNTTITGLGVGGLPSATVGSTTLAAGAVTRSKMGTFGAALQVVSAFKTDPFSTTSTSGEITGLSVSITPTSSSSRILIFFSVAYDNSQSDNSNDSGGGFRIFRNGSHLTGTSGQASASRFPCTSDFGGNPNADQSGLGRYHAVIDNPATTSSTTYSLGFIQSSGDTLFVNRARADPDQGDDGRFASSITVIELSGSS
jgi:hypothetical protein